MPKIVGHNLKENNQNTLFKKIKPLLNSLLAERDWGPHLCDIIFILQIKFSVDLAITGTNAMYGQGDSPARCLAVHVPIPEVPHGSFWEKAHRLDLIAVGDTTKSHSNDYKHSCAQRCWIIIERGKDQQHSMETNCVGEGNVSLCYICGL